MKAAVWHDFKDVRVEEVEPKPVQPDEVRVRVAYTGICGSDVHAYEDGAFIPVDEPNPITHDKAPLVLGHEFSGVVSEVGSNVTDFAVGDHVSIDPTLTTGVAPDDEDVYHGYAFIGLSTDGGLAPYVNVPESTLFHLPQDFSLRLAALIEPTAVAVQALKEGDLRFGQSVAVFGAGPIGALIAAVAKAAGATKIIAIDLSEERLAKAKQLGATDVINPAEVEDVVAEIHRLVPGGVDVAFEAAGVQPTFIQAVHSAKARGTVVVTSIFVKPVEFNLMDLTETGVKITSSLGYSKKTFGETVDLVSSGTIQVEDLITKEIELDDVVEQGLELLTTDKTQAKVLVNLEKEAD
ncbi:2,3-butanediol dehydrogenase [Weissella uvarum]|uniref:2,3-butanediol dehydrogenase n=1 Tax=Weissella uvarum TaxID=1479233 RepID=UPI00195F6251|nr:2,3-butanediol dehydrogenase [Weissella uvarum]MCM0594866.1 2,3-butanediol dehydrogenase [Weissella uvarum]